jgi:hypothetical protein
MPAPLEFGIKLPQLGRVKVKMRQPFWDFSRVDWDRNLAPKYLEIDVQADLRSKIAPNNRVRVDPDVKFKWPFPHGRMFGVKTS